MDSIRDQADSVGIPENPRPKPQLSPSKRILKHFRWEHLKDEELRNTSKAFSILAQGLEVSIPDGPEKTVALRKLLEAKDCAVRAVLESREDY